VRQYFPKFPQKEKNRINLCTSSGDLNIVRIQRSCDILQLLMFFKEKMYDETIADAGAVEFYMF